MSFVPRGHPQQVSHDPGYEALPGFDQVANAYDIDDRETVPEDFAVFDRRFEFSIDAAASDHNHKCERYFTAEDDGLRQPWEGERVWCNPPFSNIEPWVRKAWAEVAADVIVMLLPANRCEQPWWQSLVEPYRDGGGRLTTEFLPGRMRFMAPGDGRVRPKSGPPFGCVLLIWADPATRPTWRGEAGYITGYGDAS